MLAVLLNFPDKAGTAKATMMVIIAVLFIMKEEFLSNITIIHELTGNF